MDELPDGQRAASKFAMPATPLKLVYISSDSRKDKRLREMLETHLAGYRRANLISDWHCGLLQAGAERDRQVTEQLNGADIILLLISADFMKESSYAYDFQMRIAMNRHQSGKARVIPILLRKCDMTGAPFAGLAILPGDGKSINEYKNKDAIFTTIVAALGAAVKEREKAGPPRIVLPPKKPAISKDVLLLCDREPQQTRVEMVLEEKDRSRLPLIFIIHGESDECLTEYKDRLKNISLPEFLGSQLPLEDYPVPLPGTEVGFEYFPSIFQKNLAGNFADRSTSLNDLAEIISKNPARVMVYSRIYSSKWDQQAVRQFDAYFSFWNDFPKLAPDNRLICLLLVTHKSDSSSDISGARKARAFFEEIKGQEGPPRYKALDRLRAIVLPELKSVEEEYVINWVEARHFRKLCGAHEPKFCNITDSISDIERLYERAPEMGIPMKQLLPELERIVSNYICKGY